MHAQAHINIHVHIMHTCMYVHTCVIHRIYTCIYVHAQKIDTVDPNIARDFPRGNIPERYVGAFSTNSEILPSLLSGHFYVYIWIRGKQLMSS